MGESIGSTTQAVRLWIWTDHVCDTGSTESTPLFSSPKGDENVNRIPHPFTPNTQPQKKGNPDLMPASTISRKAWGLIMARKITMNGQSHGCKSFNPCSSAIEFTSFVWFTCTSTTFYELFAVNNDFNWLLVSQGFFLWIMLWQLQQSKTIAWQKEKSIKNQRTEWFSGFKL